MGFDKSKAMVHGRSLARIACSKLEHCCREVVISVQDDTVLLPGYTHIPDIYSDLGPLGGLYSVMKQVPAQNYMVLATDLPRVPGSFLEFLAKSRREGRIVVPTGPDQRTEPLVALYPGTALPVIEALINSGKYAMHGLFEAMDTVYLDYTERGYSPDEFLNINRVEDLEKLRDMPG